MSTMIGDDLGFCMLMLCAKRDSGYPTIVLQLGLSIFGTLLNSLGPCLRIMTECILKQVYIKALSQLLETMSSQV